MLSPVSIFVLWSLVLGHTAIDKVVDLFLRHAGAFGCAEGLFLFLSPFIDEVDISGVAVNDISNKISSAAYGRCLHVN